MAHSLATAYFLVAITLTLTPTPTIYTKMHDIVWVLPIQIWMTSHS